jgi:predicted nucleic acid-binding Zn finger protein
MSSINLSWNGIGNDGAKALGDALKLNAALEVLDITNNRIMTEGSVYLGKGLAVNESLKTLKVTLFYYDFHEYVINTEYMNMQMGRNPMQSAGCYAVCAALLRNPNTAVNSIDFSDIMVNSDFLDILKKVQEQTPSLKVRTGGDVAPLRPKAKLHPMMKLKNYIEKNNMRLVDFFNTLDKDRSMGVTRQEFAQGLEVGAYTYAYYATIKYSSLVHYTMLHKNILIIIIMFSGTERTALIENTQ